MRRAFTLIEVIVVIGILGLLIALLLPMLVGAKEKSGEVISLANLHSLGLNFHSYAAENGDTLPFYEPSSPLQIFPEHPDAVISNDQVWFIRTHWPALAVWREMAPWEENYETWLSPGSITNIEGSPPWWMRDGDRWQVRWPSYHYSNNFVAKNSVWSDTPPSRNEAAQQRNIADVRSPSLKVMLWDNDRAYLRPAPTPLDPRPVFFVDGAASLRLDADATPPADNPHFGNEHIYNDTPAGLAGRDFQ